MLSRNSDIQQYWNLMKSTLFKVANEVFIYTESNWKLRTNFGHEFHKPEQEEVSINNYIPKY
jgi:hypothetical protein